MSDKTPKADALRQMREASFAAKPVPVVKAEVANLSKPKPPKLKSKKRKAFRGGVDAAKRKASP